MVRLLLRSSRAKYLRRLLYVDSPLASSQVSNRSLSNRAPSEAKGVRFWRVDPIDCLLLGALTLTSLATHSLLPLLALPLKLIALYLFRSHQTLSQAIKFEREYPALLLALASSVRAGADPLVALMQLESLFPPASEVAKAIATFRETIDGGADEEQAIVEFASSLKHPDITMFRTALQIARREGASISSTLYRLVRVTRSRQSLRRKARAAVMSQRLSSLGIAALALLIALGSAVANPGLLGDAVTHPLGSSMMWCGGLLIAVGVIWSLILTRGRL